MVRKMSGSLRPSYTWRHRIFFNVRKLWNKSPWKFVWSCLSIISGFPEKKPFVCVSIRSSEKNPVWSSLGFLWQNSLWLKIWVAIQIISKFRGQRGFFLSDMFKNLVKPQLTKLLPLLMCRVFVVELGFAWLFGTYLFSFVINVNDKLGSSLCFANSPLQFLLMVVGT